MRMRLVADPTWTFTAREMFPMRAFDRLTRNRREGMTARGDRTVLEPTRRRSRGTLAAFDVLEDRKLLSTLDITSGALTYDATTTASHLTVSSTGQSGTETFTDTDQVIVLTSGTTAAGWSGSGTNTVSGPMDSVTSMAVTTSSSSGQSLTLDYTTADPVPASGLVYDPTAATGEAVNSLTLQSGTGGITFTSETYSATGAGAGAITYTNSAHSGGPITFSNLSPLNDTIPSLSFVFDATAASTTVNILDGPTVGATQTDQINDGGTAAFELVNFGNKTAATANVNNSGATTTVDITAAAAGLSSLSVNSKAGTDTINVEATPGGVTTTTDTGSGSGSTTNVGNAGVLTDILGNVLVRSTGGSNTLAIDDSANGAANTYSIVGGVVTASTFTGLINFSGGGITTLDLTSPGAGDTVNFTGPVQSAVKTFNLSADGGPGPNTLVVNSSVPQLSYTGTGVLGFGAGEPVINYSNFQTVDATKPATPPVGTPSTITATEGQSLNNVVVATFTEPDLGTTSTDFSATINWGDSTTSIGTIQSNGSNGYNILGSHTYAAAGPYSVHVTLTDLGSSGTTTVGGTTINVTSTGPVNSSPSPIVSSASIAAAPIVAQGVPVSGVEGTALNPTPGGDVLVATFMDTGTPGVPGDYTASINWGDGSTPTAATRIISQGTPDGVVFSVYGNHTYATTGSFPVVTTITKTASGSTAIAASSATITQGIPVDSVENLTGVAIAAAQDVEFTKTVATFNDTSTAAVASDFLATINWGDGTTTAGAVSEDASNKFYVTGTHTYTAAGSFTPIVTIKDPYGTLYATGAFNQTNLVSSVSGMAAVIDPNLINPWGESSSSTSPIWVSDQGSGVSTLYNPSGSPIKQALTVTIPAIGTPSGPTGQVFNSDTATTDFTIPGPSGPVRSTFLFATLSGTIAGWNPGSNGGSTAALTAATVTGATFTGLAQASVTSGTTTTYYLYAADFTGTTGASGIDVFNASFTNVSGTTFAGKFVDPSAVAGYTPYNIAFLNGDLYVAYAKPSGIVTTGGGYVDEFDTSGNFINRIYTDTAGTNLAGPWGMAIAPAGFGGFGGDLLVGNFGNATGTVPNGTIVAIKLPTTPGSPGTLAGTLSTPNGTITNPGVWGLLFGNGGSGGSPTTLYFTAGIDGQTQGLFGEIALAPAPPVSVAAAPLDAQGATIRGIEGNTLSVSNGTADVLVATFMDTGTPGAASSYSATINWGDGSASTADTRITSQGTPNGTVYSVYGNHTYASVGTYPVTVTITNSANGAVAVASSQAVIQPPTLTPVVPQPTVTTPERVIFSGPVGEFTDSNPSATASQFSDLIDWGDGTPESAGTVTLIASSPTSTTFEITGTHTFADLYDSTNATAASQTSSTFPLLIHVVGTDYSSVNLTNTATVTGGPFVVAGHLDSASDSGVSDSDGITNVTQPTIDGTASEPDARVFLYAQSPGGSPVLIGETTASSNGNWSITPSIALTDGSYVVTATAYDATNGTITTTSTAVPDLVIDTVGPKVTDVVFNRIQGQIVVTFQDFGGVGNNGVGLNAATVIDANNYQLTTVHHPRVGKYRFNVISDVPGTLTGTQTATLTINKGGYMKGGWYFFTIRSVSPSNLTGVQDIAGNALDGEFYGYFPSGNNKPGGDFVAQLTAIHHTIFTPSTIIGRATPVSPPGTRPGSIHIKQTINPGKLPASLRGHVAEAKKKADVRIVRRTDLIARRSGTSAVTAGVRSQVKATGSSSVAALRLARHGPRSDGQDDAARNLIDVAPRGGEHAAPGHRSPLATMLSARQDCSLPRGACEGDRMDRLRQATGPSPAPPGR